MKWEYLREEEFDAAVESSGGLCVMCVGCLEKHGQHLPVGTDSLKGDRIVELAAEKAGVVMFPTTMWLGDLVSAHSADDPAAIGKYGFVGMNPHTLLTVLEELCDEIARNGFKKILLCASHGGNTGLLKYFLRAQTYEKKGYATMLCTAYDFATQLNPVNMYEAAKADPEYFDMLTDEDMKILEKWAETGTGGGHADFRETALMQGSYPELVRLDRADAESGIHLERSSHLAKAGVMCNYFWSADHPNSYSGYAPTDCTRNIGDAAVKLSVDRLASIFELVKNDDECLKMAEEALPC
jgi:creatinine amidohydrolase